MKGLSLLNNLLNTKDKNDLDIEGHISMKASQFAQLEAIGSTVDESMKVALLISSLDDLSENEPMIASIHTLGQETTS